MHKKILIVLFGLFFVGLFTGHVLQFYTLPLIKRLELTAYDTRLQYTAPYTTDSRVAIIDIDEKEISPLMLAHIEYGCRPFTEVDFDDAGVPIGYKVGPKIEKTIPTKNGYHLITKRFDVQAFSEKYPDIDIQKKNPTLLYYPNSLG